MKMKNKPDQALVQTSFLSNEIKKDTKISPLFNQLTIDGPEFREL
jgi:hypothetical protein